MKTAYSILSQTGQLTEVLPLEGGLPVGCIIYSYGYGMDGTQGCVVAPPDSRGNQLCVYVSEWKHGYFTIGRYIQPKSKKFGIGKYYDDAMLKVSAQVVAEHTELADKSEIEDKFKRNAKEEADAKETESMPARFPHLAQNQKQDQSATKKNILADLKSNFPGIRFSGRKEYYDCYSFSWNDGPTEQQVTDVIKKFEDHKTDSTGDFRDMDPSSFNKVFGGFKYVSANRSVTADVKELACMLEPMLGNIADGEPQYFAESLVARILRNTPYPDGKAASGIARNSNGSGTPDQLFYITFE